MAALLENAQACLMAKRLKKGDREFLSALVVKLKEGNYPAPLEAQRADALWLSIYGKMKPKKG